MIDAGCDGMRFVEGGVFWMGSDAHYPEERPARRVSVGSFWIDQTPVTNRQFAAFVAASGYVTLAEKPPDPTLYPDADPVLLRAGSSVFFRPQSLVSLSDPFQWWRFEFGANWRRPAGPASTSDADPDHPVVHVAYEDAKAYADWIGKELPSEAAWEYAARGGLDRKAFAWGDELAPGGVMLANYWQGQFPHVKRGASESDRTSPVGRYPANAYGLYDMVGNVWEWTADWYSQSDAQQSACCILDNPRGGTEQASLDRASGFGRKVLKGGSHLCAENYCQRYRPAARYAQTVDTSTSHIGFRCVRYADR